MASRVLSSLVCVLCVILLPAVWADYCLSYTDTNGQHYEAGNCGSLYCCGNCNHKYCCTDRTRRLTHETQQRCTVRPGYDKKSKLAMLLGSILGSVLPILFLCVCVVICCVAPCCLFYKKCRKGGGRRNQIVVNNPTVIGGPQQPLSPSGNQPSYPGYGPVPVQPGFGGLPFPQAPPSYTETFDPAPPPGAFTPGMPMLPFPSEPYEKPPNPDEHAPLPYNPAYPAYPSYPSYP